MPCPDDFHSIVMGEDDDMPEVEDDCYADPDPIPVTSSTCSDGLVVW